MAKLQICPHCGEEITEQDIQSDELYREFCETITNQTLNKIGRRWFNVAIITVLLSFVLGTFSDFSIGHRSINLMAPGMLLALVMLYMAYRKLLVKKAKLFEEFEKSRTAQ